MNETGLGFNIFYTKSTDSAALNSETKVNGAMDKDAGLPAPAKRSPVA